MSSVVGRLYRRSGAPSNLSLQGWHYATSPIFSEEIHFVKIAVFTCLLNVMLALGPSFASGQSLGNAGTIEGTVVDPSGANIPGALVTALNPVTGYRQSARQTRRASSD